MGNRTSRHIKSDTSMAKIRLVDGIQLPENLYQTPRKEPGKWRYKRPDGSYFTFPATTEEAVAAAKVLNDQFAAGGKPKPTKAPEYGRLSLRRHVEDYIAERENRDPAIANKQSWKNRKGYLRQFATLHAGSSVARLTLLQIQDWWDTLSGNAQRSRKAEFRKFFNYLIGRGLCPALNANPFSDSDAVPSVEMSPRPAKSRLRLTQEAFWTIYNKAGEQGQTFLQIAMGISLVTTLRRGDICELTWEDHVAGNVLRKQISKSHAQLSSSFEITGGKALPANLSWDMEQHRLLRKVINRAREESMKNVRCPFILSHRHQRRYRSSLRKHPAQVLPDYLSRAFAEVRDATDLYTGVPAKSRPSFHEIRALASHLYEKAGYTTGQVRELMAHTDEKITERYLAGHETRWTEIGIVMPDHIIAGEL